ncbi:NAD(P)H-dependent glycerol-3-phosphate dehydrogenase [Anaeroselena agilis]|uniref:Glycerol-3-phosphate dehydrogenase [NAD(P)+] n=1 Tax=Anaeroselena agilis TaxID=3063788 RepID=A0ABU3NZB8_9FIRM|nr:NAD(P)H-dependent glycerol-3-phosphate dehydrogenase [Selenomonadales bacterium 4137-cl]
MKIAVIGAGGWGTALATVLGENNHQVSLWARSQAFAAELAATRHNPRYLPDAVLPDGVVCTADLDAAARGAAIVIIATPSHAVRAAAGALAEHLAAGAVVVSAAKGLEIGSLKRMSEVIVEEIPAAAARLVALSGPNHAEEVALRQPTATVAASASREAAEAVQDALMAPYFRVYTNPDIIGVELGGALKNIVALGAGIGDGLGFGDNAKAALMTRGLAEITRLGVAMGASPLTFAGLAGIGDLIVTCTSSHSRNRRAGLALAAGKTVGEIEGETGMVVEGIRSTLAAHQLAGRLGVEMPITAEIHRVLYQGADPREAVGRLMGRGRTHEVEEGAEIENW